MLERANSRVIKVLRFADENMHLVALIILVPGRASISATVSSYEGFKFCISKCCESSSISAYTRTQNLRRTSRERSAAAEVTHTTYWWTFQLPSLHLSLLLQLFVFRDISLGCPRSSQSARSKATRCGFDYSVTPPCDVGVNVFLCSVCPHVFSCFYDRHHTTTPVERNQDSHMMTAKTSDRLYHYLVTYV